jgi:septal ring factor EnvC (AmiA/AmiB activator)
MEATPPPKEAEAQEHIDGLRAWLAQVDRKLGIRTYALAAAVVLALAAGIVGLVLTLQTQDDVNTLEDELQGLRTQLGAVDKSASQAAEEEAQALTDRMDQLESRVSGLEDDRRTSDRRMQVVEDDIDDLRTQISDLESSQQTGSGGSGTTTTTTSTGSP